KLRHLEGWNEARRERAAGYDLLLADVEGVDPLALADGAVSSRHQYVVTVPERDAALDALAERGIGAGVHYPVPLHRQPALEERMGDVSLPNSEWLADHVLSLPIFPELTPEQQEQVVAALAEHLEQAGASSAALGA
nr:DegT/DnrJ/EryC1/StrS family aminotransferase [Thermoleophilaceae bacterium]